jgi:glycerol-3-phosphate acyltransferase PlsY
MRPIRLLAAALFGYLVGTFPTHQFAARIYAGDPDASGTAPLPGVGGTAARAAAFAAKGAAAAGMGAVLAGRVGAGVGAVAAVLGHLFPVWKLSRKSRPAGPAVSG